MKQTGLVLIAVLLAWSGCKSGQGQRTKVVTTEKPLELTHTSGDPYADCGSERIENLVRLTNQSRQDREELPPVHCSPELADVAQAHADDMCAKNYISHTSKDGRTMVDRVEQAGVDFMALGENVAMGQRSPQMVHDQWMGSSYHRKNILNDKFSRLGVGYAHCGGKRYWVELFGN